MVVRIENGYDYSPQAPFRHHECARSYCKQVAKKIGFLRHFC
jgi:hypothetical protein